MDRQAFKQRMQNLKSYRENNPGKGYWDWKVEAFAEGGQTGDPEKERFYQATGRSSSGRPLEEGLKPAPQDSYNIEDILSEDQINSIKLFEDKKYFTQEEAHEVIEFLIKRCYELGATKNY